MAIGAPSEVVDTGRVSGSASWRWTTLGLTVVAPVAYAALFNLSFRTDENPANGPDDFMLLALVGLKLMTIVALAVGLHWIGARITASRAVASIATVIWALVGASVVAVAAWAKSRGVSLGVDHLWPGQSNAELLGHLDPGPGPDWNPTRIVAAEILAVVTLAAGVPLMLRLAGARLARLLVTALTMAGFLCGLLIYDRIVGWPVMFDFDPFVGDVVLGALTYELVLLPLPIDPLGAIALAAIAVTNGLILTLARWIPTGRGVLA